METDLDLAMEGLMAPKPPVQDESPEDFVAYAIDVAQRILDSANPDPDAGFWKAPNLDDIYILLYARCTAILRAINAPTDIRVRVLDELQKIRPNLQPVVMSLCSPKKWPPPTESVHRALLTVLSECYKFIRDILSEMIKGTQGGEWIRLQRLLDLLERNRNDVEGTLFNSARPDPKFTANPARPKVLLKNLLTPNPDLGS